MLDNYYQALDFIDQRYELEFERLTQVSILGKKSYVFRVLMMRNHQVSGLMKGENCFIIFIKLTSKEEKYI